MKNAVVFEASREGYSIEQVEGNAITVGELIQWLQENCDDDDLFILSHDRRYTFGSISTRSASAWQETEDEEWEEIE